MGKHVIGSEMSAQKTKEKAYLKPWKFLNTEGRLTYSESLRAWNTIWLKKKILDEFPQLRAKRSEMCYDITFIRAYDELIKYLRKLKEEEKPLPLLLWFYEVKSEED